MKVNLCMTSRNAFLGMTFVVMALTPALGEGDRTRTDGQRDVLPAPVEGVSAPSLLYLAFTQGGPILIGDIVKVEFLGNKGDESSTRGELTVTISDRIRGRELPQELALPFVLGEQRSLKRPAFVWNRVHPKEGKQVCLILQELHGQLFASCVLDLDSGEGVFVPILRRMVGLEGQATQGRKQELFDALSDTSPLIRTLSVELLVGKIAPSVPVVRTELFEVLEAIARDDKLPADRRIEAIGMIGHKVYDGFSPDGELNVKILSFLMNTLADRERGARGEAVQILHGYLFAGGATKPSVDKLEIQDPQKIIQHLRQDIQDGQYYAAQAERVLRLVTRE